jgi:hypothetical protein
MALVTLDLRADATAEVRRVADARSFQHDGDEGVLAQCEGVGPLITRARRSALRRRLGGRMLLIWRVSCEDGAGRTVESQLVILLVKVAAVPSNWRQRDWIRAVVRDDEAPLLHRVDATVSLWRETVATVAGGFASARIQRERAIAARQSSKRQRAFQAGLFDRRAERARRADASDSEERDQHARARVTAALEAAHLTVRPGELLLVLTP